MRAVEPRAEGPALGRAHDSSILLLAATCRSVNPANTAAHSAALGTLFLLTQLRQTGLGAGPLEAADRGSAGPRRQLKPPAASGPSADLS